MSSFVYTEKAEELQFQDDDLASFERNGVDRYLKQEKQASDDAKVCLLVHSVAYSAAQCSSGKKEPERSVPERHDDRVSPLHAQ